MLINIVYTAYSPLILLTFKFQSNNNNAIINILKMIFTRSSYHYSKSNLDLILLTISSLTQLTKLPSPTSNPSPIYLGIMCK